MPARPWRGHFSFSSRPFGSRHVQSLQPDEGPTGDPRPRWRDARRHRQSALFPGIFPDYSAPIVRNAPDGIRELSRARWGMPSPVFALKGRNSDPGVTNVRNVSSPHWRRWLGVESRCSMISSLPSALPTFEDSSFRR